MFCLRYDIMLSLAEEFDNMILYRRESVAHISKIYWRTLEEYVYMLVLLYKCIHLTLSLNLLTRVTIPENVSVIAFAHSQTRNLLFYSQQSLILWKISAPVI